MDLIFVLVFNFSNFFNLDSQESFLLLTGSHVGWLTWPAGSNSNNSPQISHRIVVFFSLELGAGWLKTDV